MIETLHGIRETVNFKSNTHLRLYNNVEAEFYPNHWHAPLEIIMPLEGTYPVTCSNKSYQIKEGELLLITPGALHNMGGTHGKRLIFQADFALLHSIKDLAAGLTLISPALHITPDNSPAIHGPAKKLVLEIANEYFEDLPLSEASIYAKIIELFVLIARHHSKVSIPMNNSENKQREYIERFLFVCEYINEHFNENLTLDEIAALSGFSKYHFSRLFKQFTNTSFYKYLNRKRIENAVDLLMDSQHTITDVALRCGFSSLSAFIRMFKIIRGCTPSEFKALYSIKWDEVRKADIETEFDKNECETGGESNALHRY
ncbi:MAG: AraC family transcriptional regulator [Lachnospiraceae bacterium]|nr:AraC family transcriptional regulator [Lachnospiraceae bacterium]